MKHKGKQAGERFWRIENEILIPFVIIGILVLIAFGAVSCYNSYHIKMDYEKNMAGQMLRDVSRDIDFLAERLGEQELKELFSQHRSAQLFIADESGEIIHDSGVRKREEAQLLMTSMDNRTGWQVSYYMDRGMFWEELMEEQRYVVIAAIAALMVMVETSVFISYNISGPIRNMSMTCAEIERDKGEFRRYSFKTINRKDEIGQLARTFQNLLLSMENYTKVVYTNKMAASLAHEIKNPIAGIRSGIQLLKGRVEKEGDRMLCDSMIKEIDRVTGLITNLFTLSVKRESVRQVFAVRLLLEEICMLYTRSPEGAGVDIQFEADEDLRCFANENELKQISHNIISNSLRAMREKEEKQIRVRAYAQDSWCVLEFKDNGRGMSAEELTRVLEPFYTKNINGIGLGLSIVEKLVSQNEGALAIESEVGGGTTVTLRFHRGAKDEE